MINNKIEFKGRMKSNLMNTPVTHVITECEECGVVWFRPVIDINEICPICREKDYVN